MRTVEKVGTVALAVLGVTALGCGPDPVTLPEPPQASETAALVATYQMPTANLDASNIQQVATDAQARLADLHLDWLPGLIVDALTRVHRRLADSGLSSDPTANVNTSRPIIRAVARVHRVCVGWADPAGAPDEATNGAIDLTAVVDSGHVERQLWGTASACHSRFPPANSIAQVGGPVGTPVVNAVLDGTLIVYALGPLPDSAADAQFLLSFSGTIGTDAQVRSTSFDFQYVSGSVQFRVPVASGGDAIVSVGATLGVQGANGGFSCDLVTAVCQAS